MPQMGCRAIEERERERESEDGDFCTVLFIIDVRLVFRTLRVTERRPDCALWMCAIRLVSGVHSFSKNTGSISKFQAQER